MKHITIHESLDSFKGEKDNLLKPHVALIKGGVKPILGYAKAGSPFTAHEQGNHAFVDFDGGALTPHGGVVVEYNFTSANRVLGHGRIYSGLESLYLDGQLYDIDNLILNIDETASASASGSGDALYKSIEMPSSVSTGKHTVEFVMGDALFYEGWLADTTKTAVTVPAQNSIATHANGHEFVDLGLPSGRLWATCNVGANTPHEYGNYFMWGSNKPNDSDNCTWANTPYFTRQSDSHMTWDENDWSKYNKKGDELEPMDDAARAILGGSWMIPSRKELKELMDNCESVLTTEGGVNGRRFTAANGNSIFIPAAGNRRVSSMYDVGGYCNLWSRSVRPNVSYAYFLYFSSYSVGVRNSNRCFGLSVRGVL